MSASTFAKVENGIVTDVRVVEWAFLVANPDRYGDPSLWIECFQDRSGRGYCGTGWTYDAVNDVFIAPVIEEDPVFVAPVIEEVFVAPVVEEEPA